MSTSAPELLANRYEVIGKVADGPIAAVWRGLAHGEAGFTRPVAVRVLREPWDRERAILGAWSATASDLAQQASAHVEQTLDIVVAEGRAYVITEWIEGISLRRWLAEHARDGRAVPWQLATAIAVEVLRGLASAHAATPPICHEGIDPRGVRLARGGLVKLTRFGVASALAVRGAGRRKLEELGLRHPAPELVDGGSSSPASDVFAVGALLVEMLARAAFDAPPGDARDGLVRRGALRDPSASRADLPPPLLAHIARATAVDPAARFASASAMVRALTAVLREEPETSRPEALAASVTAVLDRPRPEVRPQGLAEVHTMHVDLAELTVLPRTAAEPPVESAASEPAEREPDDEPEHEPAERSEEGSEEAGRRPRYRFGYDQRRASLATRDQPSEAQPLLLVRRVETGPQPPALPARPVGLTPERTEFLDEQQVDRLTLSSSAKPSAEPSAKPDAKETRREPQGLAPQKTEFLDAQQVDRLTLPAKSSNAKPDAKPSAKPGARPGLEPKGLTPQQTEWLDPEQVDLLTLPKDPSER